MSYPFIVEYKEQFLYKEKACIVTEFATDGDLKSLMEKQINFSEDGAMEFFTMIL